ncbi:hypothetical protein PHPALM_28194 [Phytophthora palmivora]|uniref:Uncharacterized protein n=1 Tax=Phytophthora palmivora TaxID=4796 RepID=A0A2P4XAN8_9STRA|nr:hypothetical protein PHPALM_28194 [Phytophthora palmivora]
MQQVDEWKASGNDLPFTAWAGERDSASEAGTCFMDALEQRCTILVRYPAFCYQVWVSREDVSEFFKLLQRQSIPLDYDHLHRNILSTSSANVSTLHDFCQNLAPGAYLVSAGQDGVGHCFVVVSRGPGKRLLALDQNPPVTVLPLSNQQWIQHVKWVTRVEMKHGYKCRHGKRMSKTQRKRQKRLKMQEQQQ